MTDEQQISKLWQRCISMKQTFWRLRMHTASFVIACLSFAACAIFAADAPKSVLDFKVESIDGKPYDLAQHKGQVLLIVNVASQCGNTPQYKGLEAMYEKYKDKG